MKHVPRLCLHVFLWLLFMLYFDKKVLHITIHQSTSQKQVTA